MLEKLSNLTAAIQNIAVIIGLIIGGWWATKTFIFENPRFYATGSMIAGYENSLILGEILTTKVHGSGWHLISIRLKNTHQTHDLSISSDTPVSAFKILDGKVQEKVTENKILTKDDRNIIAPVGGEKVYETILQFPSKGMYFIEYNPCGSRNASCVIQKAIVVE